MVDDQLSSYERDCLDKQHKLVSTVRDNIARYKRNIQRAITMQRTFVVATMILGVVAPILVARGGLMEDFSG